MQMGNRMSICDSFHPSELPIGTGHFDIIENLLVRAIIRIRRVGQVSMEVYWFCSWSLAWDLLKSILMAINVNVPIT